MNYWVILIILVALCVSDVVEGPLSHAMSCFGTGERAKEVLVLPLDIVLQRVGASGGLDPLVVDAVEIVDLSSGFGITHQRESQGAVPGARSLVLFGQTFDEDVRVNASWGAPFRRFNRFVLFAPLPEELLGSFSALRVRIQTRDRFRRDWIARSGGRWTHRRGATLADGAPVHSSSVFCAEEPTDPQPFHSLVSPAAQLSICAVVRNEHGRIDEWLRWHLTGPAGATRIFVYDDASLENGARLKEIIESVNRDVGGANELPVAYVRWPGKSYWRQLTALNHCLATRARDSAWVIPLDVDEFIWTPPPSRSLLDVLQQPAYADKPAVWIPWLQFGLPKDDGGQSGTAAARDCSTAPLSAFQWRATAPYIGSDVALYPGGPLHVVGKSVFQPRLFAGLELTHFPKALPGRQLTPWQAPAPELSIRHLALCSATVWADQQHAKQASFASKVSAYHETFDPL